jgi:quinol monooxygenase YgiN
MYLVIAQTTAKPERRRELVDLLTQLAVASRQEPGNISYRFASDIEDHLTFSSIELWEERAHLEKHLSTPELAEGLAHVGARSRSGSQTQRAVLDR